MQLCDSYSLIQKLVISFLSGGFVVYSKASCGTTWNVTKSQSFDYSELLLLLLSPFYCLLETKKGKNSERP